MLFEEIAGTIETGRALFRQRIFPVRGNLVRRHERRPNLIARCLEYRADLAHLVSRIEHGFSRSRR